MSSLAKITIVGNLGRDAELRYTPSGTALLEFSVATNEKWNDKDGNRKEHTQWFRATLWGKQAEALKQYLTKGKLVYVDGTLRAREYTDRENQRRTSLDIRVDQIKLLGGRSMGAEQGVPQELRGEDQGVSDDDIPF
ncbi:MAG: single-stranded DNA-binding protein [Acidobacteriota bacterium]|nr:single-stranded DNA-binding protein [Acidobacteriota bacterium]